MDAFSSLDLDAACITETRFKPGRELQSRLEDLEGEHVIKVVHRSQDGRAKRVAGGVAIAFRTGSCNLRKRELKNRKDGQEILCVTGKIGRIPKKVAIIVVYILPDMKAHKFRELCDTLVLEIAAIKVALGDPDIYIAGGYTWIVKLRRTRTKATEDAFAADLSAWDWQALKCFKSVDEMAGELEKTIDVLTECHFPLVRVCKRSNEDPRITPFIRWLWKKKIHIYKRLGKSQSWWETDRRLQEEIRDAKKFFVERLLEDGINGRPFHAATRKLAAATPS